MKSPRSQSCIIYCPMTKGWRFDECPLQGSGISRDVAFSTTSLKYRAFVSAPPRASVCQRWKKSLFDRFHLFASSHLPVSVIRLLSSTRTYIPTHYFLRSLTQVSVNTMPKDGFSDGMLAFQLILRLPLSCPQRPQCTDEHGLAFFPLDSIHACQRS